MKINVNFDRLFNLLTALTVILSLLKIFNIINCSWWIALCPIWFSFIAFIIAIPFVIFVLIVYKFKS